VVWTDSKGGGIDSGCAGDFMMRPDERFRDWPKARMYRMDHGKYVQNIFAPGIHPVGFSWWETTDYQDTWEDGDCSAGTSKYWRTGLIAQLMGKELSDSPLQPEVHEVVVFTSAAAFEERVRSAIEEKSRAFGDVAGAFVQSGDLTAEDAAALHLQCRIEVVDDRPLPRADLPGVVGRWCGVPPAGSDSRLP
jgi:hypothetical protein